MDRDPRFESNGWAPTKHLASPPTYEIVNKDENPAKEQPKSKRWAWGWEITSLTLSILLVAAQVGILIFMSGKRYYESWTVFLSLNTVLAILTTAYKAAQLHAVGAAIGQLKWVDFKTRTQPLYNFNLYDETSRGPQGALQFIFQVRWGVATIGALVTLLALASDPFTQQVVLLEPRNVTTPDDTVLFGFSHNYSTDPKQTGLSGFSAPEISSRDPGIQGAIMQGIFKIQKRDEFVCGGACKWSDTYRSLGFSSSCSNVTQATAATKVCGEGVTSVENSCNYTTPGGVQFNTVNVLTEYATTLRVATNDTLYPDMFAKNVPVTNYVKALSPNFLRAAIFSSTSGADNFFNDEQIINENITECTVSLAVHEYSDIAANGSTLTIGNHQVRKLETAYYNATDGLTPYERANFTVQFNRSEAGPIDPPLVINLYDWANMVLFFESEAFTSHIVAGDGVKHSQVGIGNAFQNTDLDATFASLAASMTNYVRSLSSGPNVQRGTGSRVETVIFVRVRWAWLALPLLEELLAVLFVLYVLLQSRRSGLPAWKTSALAVLAHRYSHAERSLTAEVRGVRDLDRLAKDVKVRLRD
ncbi:hypothetical protein F5Y15DRAFT_287688 [Xylariaceae sp. FL0016]|nr:hypothetical protein F5Y15DRAFT_287688 [Xylariaceae sp. FL0016]